MGDWFTMEAIRHLVLTFPVFLFSLVFHEYAHAWMAMRRGDDLAKAMGRMTLNPLPHIDPIGTVALPVLLMLSGSGFMFGWAKPVPVNPKISTRDLMITALAGPAANVLLVPLFAAAAFGLRYTIVGPVPDTGSVAYALHEMMMAGVLWNLILASFNLIPIPPLDGSKILYYFLPYNLREKMMQLQRYSFILLIVLMISGALSILMIPAFIVYIVISAIAGYPGLS
jgi:Zn-dependent protease